MERRPLATIPTELPLWAATAAEMTRRFATGEATPEQALEAVLERVETVNGRLNAVVTLDPDGARAAATASGRPGATRTRLVEDADAAEALLREELRAGDVVLLKSSRDVGLRLLGDRLAGPREEHA